ncbi:MULTISPECIES: hypothetical protein [unclassified Arcicella]|uniref:hypothetical protein n=1 Tax=unclassified Arcicella TaxID=2644986 RepID=UPI00285C18FB|nr:MULTISPECIES: hypothetical protein [unclassified Arcicella]MDR6560209.1 hypothetical protein [Arcicella sp. BE51]MDR6810185.1 hypothetical protein [Arcicella sp. BE140]MDR6821534.1 hypothetical protein [Arcicella sp. BE139]
MLTFNIDIQKLTRQQIGKLKSWLALAIVAVLVGQSVVGYLLVVSLKDENTFSQEMSKTEFKVKQLHQETKQKLLALIDFDQSSDKQNRGTNSVLNLTPFNLFCENSSIKLPIHYSFPFLQKRNYIYLNLYYFNLYLKIPHPPQTTSFSAVFMG